MKNLLEFLVKNITGSDDFEVSENEQDSRIELTIVANKEIVGLIIGREGKTIKNLRKIVSIPAVIARKSVGISVEEKA
jgi:predicted RNA-binding protein YlqC (UPF0109 family)